MGACSARSQRAITGMHTPNSQGQLCGDAVIASGNTWRSRLWDQCRSKKRSRPANFGPILPCAIVPRRCEAIDRERFASAADASGSDSRRTSSRMLRDSFLHQLMSVLASDVRRLECVGQTQTRPVRRQHKRQRRPAGRSLRTLSRDR